MKPVSQTSFGYPDGNDLAACVASILELSVDEVPNFITKKNWYLTLALWLEKRGMTAIRLDVSRGNEWWNFYLPPETPVIWAGPSPRPEEQDRRLHCVVGRWDGRLLHDPHPDCDFLAGEAVHVIALVRLP